MINFLHMKYFLVVAETRSFSAAAKKLYISQQTISEHIAQIEKELGTKLFDRSRPLNITAAGERFRAHANEMLFLNAQMVRELKDFSSPAENSFRLAISHAYARTVLPNILKEFYEEYPNMKLEIFEMGYSEMDAALLAGQVDLIFTRYLHQDASVRKIPICASDDVYLYAPRSSLEKVYEQHTDEVQEQLRNHADLGIVRDCPFILPRSGNVRQNAEHLFLEAEQAPLIKIEVDTLETAIALCGVGMGITIAPVTLLPVSSALAPVNQEECYLLSVDRTEYALAIGYMENLYITAAMRSFIRTAKKIGQASES